MTRKSDAQLIQESLNGRPDAFGELVRLYEDRVYNFLYRLCHHTQDAQDLTQEVFIKAYESLADFQFKSGFYTWLYRIAANLFFSERRHAQSRKVIRTVPLQLAVGEAERQRAPQLPSAPSAEPGDLVQSSETLGAIQEAIDSLSDDHKVVVLLRHVEGLDCLKISEVLEWPVGTVKSRLHRARLELREKLKDLV